MSNRLAELATRRRQLLIRSDRLRAELAADQEVMLEALSGIERAIHRVKRAAKPVFLAGAGLLLLKLLRGRGKVAAGMGGRAAAGLAAGGGRSRGLLMRMILLISTVRRALPYLSLARSLWRSRSSRYGRPYADAGAETEHLL